MKTIIKFMSPISNNSVWRDYEGKMVCIESTSWFNNYSFYPIVSYYYIKQGNISQLMIVDRYTFVKYMNKLHD
jgi:hypothetical protein